MIWRLLANLASCFLFFLSIYAAAPSRRREDYVQVHANGCSNGLGKKGNEATWIRNTRIRTCACCLAVASLETHKLSNQQAHNSVISVFYLEKQSNKNGIAISTWKFI